MAARPVRKAVLVTGSTSGIGLGVARRFAAAGYDVGLNSFEPPEQVEGVLGELQGAFEATEIVYFQADLSTGNGGELVQRFLDRFGRMDVLVNNAGIQKVAPVDAFDPADWERVRTIILDAAFETIRAALPDMKSRQNGRIINIASAHALVASPYKAAYVSAKHGVMGLTRTVALEVAEQGITVNAICPGYVLTPLVEKQLEDQARAHNISREEVKRQIMLAPQPTGQFVRIEEVAELALYLCGDLARSITGTSIAIDGGWTAR